VAKSDFVKYLTPKAIINLSIIVGFLIFVISILLFLGNEVGQRAASIRAQRLQIDAHTRMIAKLAEFREASAEAESATADLHTIIPPREKLFSFPKNIEQLGLSVDVAANADFVGKEKPATNDEAGSNMFTIKGTGSFDNTLRFVKTLEERKDFLVNLESFEVINLEEQFYSVINGLVFFYD